MGSTTAVATCVMCHLQLFVGFVPVEHLIGNVPISLWAALRAYWFRWQVHGFCPRLLLVLQISLISPQYACTTCLAYSQHNNWALT